MSFLRSIYKMQPNAVEQHGDAYWRRVPGGWIVTETYERFGDERGGVIRLHPVFVPFISAAVDSEQAKAAMTELGRMTAPVSVPAPPPAPTPTPAPIAPPGANEPAPPPIEDDLPF